MHKFTNTLLGRSGPVPVIMVDLPRVRETGAEKVLGPQHDVMEFTRRGMAVAYGFRQVRIVWDDRRPDETEYTQCLQEYVIPISFIEGDPYFGQLEPGATPDWTKLARDRRLPGIKAAELWMYPPRPDHA